MGDRRRRARDGAGRRLASTVSPRSSATPRRDSCATRRRRRTRGRSATARRSSSVGHSAVAGWPEPFPAAPRNMDEVPRAAWDAPARLEYMDSIGTWAQVIYPNVGGFGNQGFLSLGDPDLMLACVRAYNDWLTEWCATDARRLLGRHRDAVLGRRRVRRPRSSAAPRSGHRGVLFTGEPQHFGLPYLGDRHWDPLLRRRAGGAAPDQLPHRQRRLREWVHARAHRRARRRRDVRRHVGVVVPRQRRPDRRPAALGCSRRGSPSCASCRSRAGSASCRSSSRRPTTRSRSRRPGRSARSWRCSRASTSTARCTGAGSSRSARSRISSRRSVPTTSASRPTIPHPDLPLRQRAREDRGRGRRSTARGARKVLWGNAARLYKVARPDPAP